MGERIDWIDIAKGMGIFLMVIGHTTLPHILSKTIYLFHMPLFFVLSGAFIVTSINRSFGDFFVKETMKYVIPYTFFLLCYIVYLLIYGLPFSGIDLLLGCNVGPIWFLQTLFISHLVFYVIKKYLTNIYYKGAIVIFSITSYLMYLYQIHLPYRLEVCGLALIFIVIGYKFRYRIMAIKGTWKLTLSVLILFIVLSFIVPRLDMNTNSWGSPFTLAESCLGILMIFLLSKHLELLSVKNPLKCFLLWAGKNSIVVLGFSSIINMSLKFIFSSLLEPIMPYWATLIIRHIILWSLLYFVSLVLTNYTPILIGIRKKQ